MGNLDYQTSCGVWCISTVPREYFSAPDTLMHCRMEYVCLSELKIPPVWPFPRRALCSGVIQTPLTVNVCKHTSRDTTFPLWKGPLSFPSLPGDFSAPCSCGFLQDTRPKSRWIQLPGNSPGTLRFHWLLCRFFMEGKCGINTPHTTSSPGISTTGQ